MPVKSQEYASCYPYGWDVWAVIDGSMGKILVDYKGNHWKVTVEAPHPAP